MARQSELRIIKRCAEFIPREKIRAFARGLRGIYVLYRYDARQDKHNVLYVGMATTGRRGGVRGRLWNHHKRKGRAWTHFSVFEAWDNVTAAEIAEVEGLLRHIYRNDVRANQLNVQRGFRKMKHLRDNNLTHWGKAH